MKIYIPFRYKLTVIIALIILSLLAAIFTVVQRDIELKFRVLIESRLQQAKDYVNQRMDDRYDLLRNDATAIVDDKLIRDIITDKTLSPLTRNDIVSSEVLPKFVNLDLLAVTDPDGGLLAYQQDQQAVTKALISSQWYQYSMGGETVAGYILHDNRFYQGIAMPVFLGQQMIGIIVAGTELDQQDIIQIKKTSDIDLAVLSHKSRIIATEFAGISDPQTLLRAFEQWLAEVDDEHFVADKTFEVNLGQERFLLQLAVDETSFVPNYIIVRSLDESLAFVTNIRSNMEMLGYVGFAIAIVIGFIFAVGVSSPIRRLSLATIEVAKENFSHRVAINSQDEFSRLGQSFNQMIIGLADKQKIRSALDKSVSKVVADHMLAQGVELGGTTQYATILFADIRGFTTLSEILDEKSLINLLNSYFTEVNRCVVAEKGVIDKFIGDAVMALFGTPIPCEYSAYHGLQAARHMLKTVYQFNQQNRDTYDCEINIGIGLNSGKVVAGLVGSEDRLNYTVLGDQVNVASRIEGLCKEYGVSLILTESTVNDIFECREKWQDPIHFRQLDCVQVKGKTEGVHIYEPFFAAAAVTVQQIECYQQALAYVLKQQLDPALALLAELVITWPEDAPTVKLYNDCRFYLAEPAVFAKRYVAGVRILTEK